MTSLDRPVDSMGPLARATSALRLAIRASGVGVLEFLKSSNLTFASSIAYYTLLSLFPFLFLVLSVVSRVAIGHGKSEAVLLQFLVTAFPSRFEFVAAGVQSLAQSPLHLSVVSTVLTLWAATGMFGAVTSAVNHAWGVERAYSFWKHKLIAIVMTAAAGLLAVVALAIVSTLEVANTHPFAVLVERVPQFMLLTGFVSRHLPTPLFILVVGLIYYFVPNTRVRIRDVWFGAVLAGLLWRAAFDGFAWYLRGHSRYGVDGPAAAVMAFLVWVYLSAVILLYGVEVTAAYARLRTAQIAGVPIRGTQPSR